MSIDFLCFSLGLIVVILSSMSLVSVVKPLGGEYTLFLSQKMGPIGEWWVYSSIPFQCCSLLVIPSHTLFQLEHTALSSLAGPSFSYQISQARTGSLVLFLYPPPDETYPQGSGLQWLQHPQPQPLSFFLVG